MDLRNKNDEWMRFKPSHLPRRLSAMISEAVFVTHYVSPNVKKSRVNALILFRRNSSNSVVPVAGGQIPRCLASCEVHNFIPRASSLSLNMRRLDAEHRHGTDHSQWLVRQVLSDVEVPKPRPISHPRGPQ